MSEPLTRFKDLPIAERLEIFGRKRIEEGDLGEELGMEHRGAR